MLTGMLILSILPVGLIGFMAYSSERQNIINNVQSHLESVAILKKQAISNWTEHLVHAILWVSNEPIIVNNFEKLESKRKYSKNEVNKVIKHIKKTFNQVIELGHIAEFSIISVKTGQILLSSNPNWEGNLLEYEPFFIQGKKGLFISEIFQTPSMGKPTMVISLPLKNDRGKIICVLAAHANLDQLSSIMLERTGLSQTTETFLVNKSNLLITNTVFAPDGAFKKWIFGDGAKWAISGKSGVDVFIDYRSVKVIGAYLWLPERKLALIAKQDASEAFFPVIQFGIKFLIIGLLISVVVLFTGFNLAKRITQPIQEVVKGAKRIGTGDLDHRLGVLANNEIGQLSYEFDQMAENLKQITTSDAEKEILLREIHHRVKNNLQMIQSMLNLQINQSDNKHLQNQLKDSINRIYSISLVHERLYQSDDMSLVDLESYFSSLTDYLLYSLKPDDSQIELECTIDQFDIDIDTIITCGLIINELMTNSIKYAFNGRPGKILVQLKLLDKKRAGLIVSDNGMGFKTASRGSKKPSLGLNLVKILVENQLEGSMKMDTQTGLTYYIQFPIT